jgi:hypothetical protein
VHELISWRHSFGRLNEEHELARKKKQALDSLLEAGKISQSTHSLFNKEIDDAIAEIEKQQKALLEKMSSKMTELEGHIKTLEILLTNFEIQHVTGEIEDEPYQRETNILSTGLEAARKELETIKEATNQLSGETPTEGENLTENQEPQPTPQENQIPQPEPKLEEQTPPTTQNEPSQPTEQTIVETIEITEPQQAEAEAQTEEKHEN